MPAMTLRNLDPDVLETLRERARAQGRSLHSLICEILTEAADEERRRARMVEQRPDAERLRRRLERRGGKGTPSEKLLRKDRRR